MCYKIHSKHTVERFVVVVIGAYKFEQTALKLKTERAQNLTESYQ